MRLNDLFVLPLLTLFVLLAACDDPVEELTFSEADLTLVTGWAQVDARTNLAERADDLASRLSTDQLDQIGYDTPEEYADDLKLAAALAGVGYEPCVKNDAAIFTPDGDVAFDYSDDCTGAGVYAVPLLEEDRDYSWSLSGNTLTITEFDANTSIRRNYLIMTLTDTELVLRETEAGLYGFLFEGEDIGAVDLSDLFLDYYFMAR